MGSSRSSVVADSGRASFQLSARSAQVARIHAKSCRHGVVSHGQRGLSVPLRWRPAHDRLPVITLQSKSGISSKQAWALHASEIAGAGQEILAGQAPVSEQVAGLSLSQRLKPQCAAMQMHSNAKISVSAVVVLAKIARFQPWHPVIEVSASKADGPVVQQTPNPSFKRTRLRRSA